MEAEAAEAVEDNQDGGDPNESEHPDTPAAPDEPVEQPTNVQRLNMRTTSVLFEISTAELQFRSKQLAREVSDLRVRKLDLERHNESAKAGKTAIQADIDERQASVNRIAEVVRTGREDRTVEVYDVLRGEENRVVTVRCDNGEETGTRGMNSGERAQWLKQEEAKRQRDLFPGVAATPLEGGGPE